MTEKINYNGKEYPIKVGFYALKHTAREVKEQQGKELGILDVMSNDITILEPLLFYSLIMGARLEKQTLDITREEAEFVLDECLPQFIAMVPKFFKATFESENVEKTETEKK